MPGALRALALLGALWLPEAAHALDLVPHGEEVPGEVQMTADRVTHDRESDRVSAEGNVVVTRGGTRLTAKKLVWDRGASVLEGEGDIVVVDGENRLEAESIVWRLNDATGEVHEGELTLDGRYHLEGALISRTGPDRYEIGGGVFSTCACVEGRRRPWSITARRLRARVQGTLVARGVRFRIKDVPVFYAPVFFFPTSPRQTGLLIPSLGSDSRNGFRFVQPFYWAISPSHDLTVAYDHRSRRGPGGMATYRYMLSRHSEGEIRTAGIKDRETGNRSGEAHWQHSTRKDGGWSFFSDIHGVTDRDYFRTLSDGIEVRTDDSLESTVNLARAGENRAMTVAARRITSLVSSGTTTVQQLPRFRAEQFDHRLGRLPFWVGARLDGAYLYREVGERTTRIDSGPYMTARIPLLGGRLALVPRAEARMIWYSEIPSGTDGHLAETYPLSTALSGRIAGTLFGRIHQVLPSVTYRYVPVNRSDAAPFDMLEAISEEHEVVFRLDQQLGTLGWLITTPYDLEDHRIQPVRSELFALWKKGLYHLDTFHGPEDGRVERIAADWAVEGSRGAFSVGELYDRGSVAVGTALTPGTFLGPPTGAATHVETYNMLLKLWKGWYVDHRMHYDGRDHRPVDTRYGLGYEGSCWRFEVGYIDLTDREVVKFRISLTGAGGDADGPPVVRHPLFGSP